MHYYTRNNNNNKNSRAHSYREEDIFLCFSIVRKWKLMTPGMGLLLTGAIVDTRGNKRCGCYPYCSPLTIRVAIAHCGQLAVATATHIQRRRCMIMYEHGNIHVYSPGAIVKAAVSRFELPWQIFAKSDSCPYSC